jgi:hypothetical protein
MLTNTVVQDLCLLTNITHEDIQRLQTVSKSEQTERAQYILKDDGPLAWDLLNKARQGGNGVSRVDFILDNGEWPLLCQGVCSHGVTLVAGFEVSCVLRWRG